MLARPDSRDPQHANIESSGKHSLPIAIGLATWLAAVVAGMVILGRYSLTAGMAASPPLRWSSASGIPLAYDRFTLIMVAHPQCPCTRASLGELASLMALAGDRMKAYVVFVQPPGLSEDLVHGRLWAAARAIPGVTAILDNGTETRRFGAETSGQTMVYDNRGNLRFSGGITAARGHWGDNSGLDAIAGLSGTKLAATIARSPVFGCALFATDPSRRPGR